MVVGFALAALNAGATALRIESARYVRAVRAATAAPIIGIVKRDLADSPVRITPWISDVEELAGAGADVIAFDATSRPRPAGVGALIGAIKARGRLAMADCASLDDARTALEAGADFVGTTLSGYVEGPEPDTPDLWLISAMRALSPYVIAEGRIRTPEQATAAVRAGAYAVVVGSAITRPEHVTSWFKSAVDAAYGAASDKPVLGIDLGGTKMLAALVEDGKAIVDVTIPTARDSDPDVWIAAIERATADWKGRYSRAGIAVTGVVNDGLWSALNPATLNVPPDYPLVQRLEAAFGVPVLAANDAQAAAWAEYRFGAGRREDLVFLTISTGIGGGIVIGGRPLLGLAGHFGLLRSASQGASPIEDEVSGRWIAAQAGRLGYAMEAPGVFAAAKAGEDWAHPIIAQSARRVALLCHDIHLMLDPKRIVIGGGIGLAEGYLDLVEQQLPQARTRLRPVLAAARLGRHAGVIGVADLALTAG